MSLLSRLLQRSSIGSAAAGRGAFEADPKALEAALKRADESFRLGDLSQARASYNDALALNPRHARSHAMLSAIAIRDGDTGAAIERAQKAVELEPDNADFHFALANGYWAQSKLPDAIRAYQEALRLKPDVPEWQFKLALALTDAGRLNEALVAYRARLAIDPPDARVYFDLGELFRKRGELRQAEDAFQQAATLAPDSAGIQSYLAIARRDQGRPVDAEGPARAAIAIAPDMPQGWFALGSVLVNQARHEEAAEQFRQAIRLMPDYDDAWSGLLFAMNYSEQWSPREVFEAHVEWGKLFRRIEPMPNAASRRGAGGRIRVGYLSYDFRQHPIAHFIDPALRYHDRTAFEVFCYHTDARTDAITARLKGWVEHWRSAPAATDDELERVLREDRLDILVELSGHSDGNRLQVLARRVAPVQVTYLAYPNTTGLASIDYRITDAVADPPGEADELHVEKLVRLPGSFLCYSAPDVGASSRTPPVRRKGHITFGSFNNFPKMTRTCIALWARVLASVPDSRLFIKTHGLDDPGLRALLLERLIQAGIRGERVSIAGPTRSHREHMESYGEVDIALDTFPYHGTTTTLDALWMGVPVVTLAGDRHASRVGVSILSALGLTELVAQTADEYVAAAVRLANDPEKLEELGRSLRQRLTASPLTNGRAFAAKLEAAYLNMLELAT